MNSYVLPLNDPLATLENVGGKGMSLAILSRAGLPVPDGFHVTTHAYRRFVAENEIQARLLAALAGADPANPAALEAASQAIRGLFEQGAMPPEIGQFAFWSMMGFLGVLTVGFIYEWKKGALDWE